MVADKGNHGTRREQDAEGFGRIEVMYGGEEGCNIRGGKRTRILAISASRVRIAREFRVKTTRRKLVAAWQIGGVGLSRCGEDVDGPSRSSFVSGQIIMCRIVLCSQDGLETKMGRPSDILSDRNHKLFSEKNETMPSS